MIWIRFGRIITGRGADRMQAINWPTSPGLGVWCGGLAGVMPVNDDARIANGTFLLIGS
jgi:hypothetical protein